MFVSKRPTLLVSVVVALASVTVSSWPHAEDAAAEPNPAAPIEGAKNLHLPFEGGECSSCHEGEGPTPGAIQEGGDSLCFLCHTEIEDLRESGKVKHNENGSCIDCHNPHGSNFPSLLLAEPRTLCTSCHTDVADEASAAKSDHGPMNSPESCVACHNPHASDHESLLITNEKQLCMLCHMQPQRADDGRMLPDMNALLTNAPMRHKPAEERCASCHAPHGSQHQKLLAKAYPAGFYAPFSAEAYALCFSCHDAKLVTEASTTTATGFRDGERNLHAVHVDRGERGRSCRACHDAHTGPNAVLVHDDVAFGSHGWRLPLNFQKTADGGNCTKTCHLVREYSRTK